MITSIQVRPQYNPGQTAGGLSYFQEGVSVSISDGYFDQILSCDSLIKEDSEPSETGADYLQFLQVSHSHLVGTFSEPMVVVVVVLLNVNWFQLIGVIISITQLELCHLSLVSMITEL